MFSKSSRYRKLPNVVTTDVRGRVMESRQLRLPPMVTGERLHTVKEGDRLDHLAHMYYRKPQKWWRICDANPAFLSPRALLGKGPHHTVRFSVIWNGPVPPWPELMQSISQASGVEEVLLGRPEQDHPEVQYLDGETLFVVREAAFVEDLHELASFLRTGQPTTARRSADEHAAMLRTALEAEGLAFDGAVRLVDVEPIRWCIQDVETGQLYAIQLEGEGTVHVYESMPRHLWEVTLRYNGMNTSPGELVSRMQERGFEVGRPEEIGQVGKSISIPLNVTR